MNRMRAVRWLAMIALGLAFSHQGYAEQGRQIYNEYCHMCHGGGMPDVPQFGKVDDWEPLKQKGTEALYNAAIYGVKAMPPKGLCDKCSEKQIKEAVDYMMSSSM